LRIAKTHACVCVEAKTPKVVIAERITSSSPEILIRETNRRFGAHGQVLSDRCVDGAGGVRELL
jgi:hypothetical protein